ncbi:MAG: hypothetical protein IM602_05350 [Cytophagales bacterium]|jgi:hypothetical protein|nr:hypothetical protein [Cytophagales bacterium]MCA6437071.1 hypothetical protein [Bacteroidota bacterium]MCA6491644.1 hypothetical protein [Chitinophagaceae bacterium]MCA6417952.1 hypothetical protein [Cytophagales bacterium]MCA6425057.1 hypothetical protein [Cytophagales bacterium]
MKIAFLIIVLLHGLIHLLGFVKGFELREVKELTLPISKTLGIVWLTLTFLFLTYGALYLLNSKYAWLIGLIAAILSQVLIIFFWKDAKFGTIPNIIILAVSIDSFGYYNFQKIIQQETTQLLNKNVSTENKPLNESDLTILPEPVKKWMRNSGVIGKPFISYGKVSQIAEIQMKPEQDNWMTATAIQYTAIDNPAFIWSVDVKMNNLLSFQGRDKFVNGKGEMLIKLNSLFNIVNERGAKLDEGTLQRYLGEMVWFPSLALSPYITWEQLDEHTAKATMTYKGTSGSGTFYFNSIGDVTKFSALRYKGNETDAKRYNWEMNISDYKTFKGIKVPAKMTSTWKLDDKDWTWLKMEVTDIKYNKNVSH